MRGEKIGKKSEAWPHITYHTRKWWDFQQREREGSCLFWEQMGHTDRNGLKNKAKDVISLCCQISYLWGDSQQRAHNWNIWKPQKFTAMLNIIGHDPRWRALTPQPGRGTRLLWRARGRLQRLYEYLSTFRLNHLFLYISLDVSIILPCRFDVCENDNIYTSFLNLIVITVTVSGREKTFSSLVLSQPNHWTWDWTSSVGCHMSELDKE